MNIWLSVLLTTLLAMVPCASPDPLSKKLRRGYRGYCEASRARAQQRAWRAELQLEDAPGILTADQVRQSFRRRSRSCHPDRNRGDPAASEQWHLLKEARDRARTAEEERQRAEAAAAAAEAAAARAAEGDGEAAADDASGAATATGS